MGRRRKKYEKHGIIEMYCSTGCGTLVSVDSNTKSVICPNCVVLQQIRKYGMPIGSTPKESSRSESKKPKGWHWLKEFVDVNGDVYCKGKLIEKNSSKKPTVETKQHKNKVETRKKKKPKITENEKIMKFRSISKEMQDKKKKLKKLNAEGKTYGTKKLDYEIKQLAKKAKKYI